MTKLEIYAPPAEAAKPLKPHELLATLREALEPWKQGEPFWIFAYGSLMWNPNFAWDARHVATVRGYHRSFRVWSRINRGTPERPGLVNIRSMRILTNHPRKLVALEAYGLKIAAQVPLKTGTIA